MRLLLVCLPVLTLACASQPASLAKLATSDVAAVAKRTGGEWEKIAITGAAVGATLLVDDELQRIVTTNDSPALDRATGWIEPFGGGHSDKVMATFLLYGVAARNERARAVAFDSFISSVIASKGITPALKSIISKQRPGDGDDQSFPSNHATQAFAVASVISSHYGHERPWVRWLAYGVASGVGFSRMYHDDHYASDVLTGAAIGTFVGSTVARTNKAARLRWSVQPILDRDRRGVILSLQR